MRALIHGVITLLLVSLSLPLSAQFHWGGPEPPVEPGFAADKLYQLGNIDAVDPSSGALSLRIPIGHSYPVNGGLSYNLVLTYSSQIWEFLERQYNTGPPYNCERYYQQAYPTLGSNAGLGWQVSLGQLYSPSNLQNPLPLGTPPGPEEEYWVYVSPDGAQHRFWPLLHIGDQPSVSGGWDYWYTRDSSYLRMRFQPDNDTVRYIEYPDGTVYSFFKHDPANEKWRLERIGDRFSNDILFDYDTDPVSGRTMWTISDGHREQKVYFTTRQAEGVDVEYIDEVELSAFGAETTASYFFTYTDTEIERNGQHDDPDVGTTNPWVPLLTMLTLPDSSTYTMSYYETCSTTPCDLEDDQPGVIKKLTLPTGGAMEWTYQTYFYSSSAQEDGCVANPCYNCKRVVQFQSAGVKERRYLDRNDAQTALWSYRTWEGWNQYASISEERRTVVTSPEGDDTVYYFRANPEKYGNCADFSITVWDYGLPFTKRYDDGDGRYLSLEHFDGIR